MDACLCWQCGAPPVRVNDDSEDAHSLYGSRAIVFTHDCPVERANNERIVAIRKDQAKTFQRALVAESLLRDYRNSFDSSVSTRPSTPEEIEALQVGVVKLLDEIDADEG